jgi:tRNA uridine 5-carbamoylmethylation protein Kti12
MSSISGGGKSTFAREIVKGLPETGYVIVSADNFFTRRGNGVYDFNPALLPVAHKECYLDFLAACSLRTPIVIVDNTNLSAWEIAPYYTHAAAMGYEVKIIRIKCDPAIAAKRNSHGVPYNSVVGMAKRYNEKVGWPPFWNVEEHNAGGV